MRKNTATPSSRRDVYAPHTCWRVLKPVGNDVWTMITLRAAKARSPSKQGNSRCLVGSVPARAGVTSSSSATAADTPDASSGTSGGEPGDVDDAGDAEEPDGADAIDEAVVAVDAESTAAGADGAAGAVRS